jgi:flagellar protein FliT
MISIYEEVATITERMLTAARISDWETLATLEKQCSGRIDMLRARKQAAILSESDRQHKIGVIRKIIDADRQIREIITPWMNHLSGLINSSGTERKLKHAYGMNQTG